MSKKQKLIITLGALFGAVLLSVLIFTAIKLLNPKSNPQNKVSVEPSGSPEVLPAKTDGDVEGTSSSQDNKVSPAPSPILTPAPSPVLTPTPAPGSSAPVSVSLDDCNTKSDSNYFNIQLTSGSSEIVITYIQPTGNPPSGGDVSFPADWKVKPSSEIANGEVLGAGCIKEMLSGREFLGPITVINNIDTQGKDARWDLVFGDLSAPSVVLDTLIEGNPGKGYTWNIQRKFLFDIQPPITINLKIKSSYLFKEKQGNFVFKAVARLIGGGENVLEKILEAF